MKQKLAAEGITIPPEAKAVWKGKALKLILNGMVQLISLLLSLISHGMFHVER
jgi:hypothetical protein